MERKYAESYISNIRKKFNGVFDLMKALVGGKISSEEYERYREAEETLGIGA